MRADDFDRRLSEWLAADETDGQASRREAGELRDEAVRRGEPEALVTLLTLRARESRRDWVDVEPPGGDWSGFRRGLAAKLAREEAPPARWRVGVPRGVALAAAVAGIAVVVWLVAGTDGTGSSRAPALAEAPADPPVDAVDPSPGPGVVLAPERDAEDPGTVAGLPRSVAPDPDGSPDPGPGDGTAPGAPSSGPAPGENPEWVIAAADDEEWEPAGFGGSPVDLVEPVGLDFPELARLDTRQRERLLQWLRDENARYGGAS